MKTTPLLDQTEELTGEALGRKKREPYCAQRRTKATPSDPSIHQIPYPLFLHVNYHYSRLHKSKRMQNFSFIPLLNSLDVRTWFLVLSLSTPTLYISFLTSQFSLLILLSPSSFPNQKEPGYTEFFW